MNQHKKINELIKGFDKECANNPSLAMDFPAGNVTTTYQWKILLGNSITSDQEKSKFADTLTGCEVLAWYIDRFHTYGAGRSIPAKLLLHQLLDVIDYFTKLRIGKGKFTPRLKQCLSSKPQKELQDKIRELWIIRHRSHLGSVGNNRDHRYCYFTSIGDAWSATSQLVDKYGGTFSQYDGLLSKIFNRENARRVNLNANNSCL